MEGDGEVNLALPDSGKREAHFTDDIRLQTFESIQLTGQAHVADCNPALWKRKKAELDIEPFPEDILSKINVGECFRVVEKDGELVVPVTGLYRSVWDGAPTYLEEKTEVWAGMEFGATIWVNSKPQGTYSISIDESLLRCLQSQDNTRSNIEVVKALTGVEYLEAKSRTTGRYIASLVTAGDNHITLLTAAYCVLFDRLWWYFQYQLLECSLTSVLLSEGTENRPLQFLQSIGA